MSTFTPWRSGSTGGKNHATALFISLLLLLLATSVPQVTSARLRRLAQTTEPVVDATASIAAVATPATASEPLPAAVVAPPAEDPVAPATVAATTIATAATLQDLATAAAAVVPTLEAEPSSPVRDTTQEQAVEQAQPVASVVTPQTYGSTGKLYLYAWCGVSPEQLDPGMLPNDNKDFVATIDATVGSSSFGKVLSITSTPYVGTEPHHCNVDKSGQWLATGGLLSLLQSNTPDIFVFDLSKPYRPAYKYGLTSSKGSCMDEFVAAKSGGFYVSSMCARNGGPGGGIVRIANPSIPKLLEYDGGLKLADQTNFTSHGIDVDYVSRRIVTADYFNVGTALIQTPQPALGMMHTAHVWDLDTMKVLKIIDLSGITDGLMESRLTTKPGLFWVSGGVGKLHLINALTYEVTPNVYCLSDNCTNVSGTCLTTNTFEGPRGPRMLITSFSLSQVRLVDVTNPRKVKTLDIYQLPKGAGAHVVKFNPETWIAAVATYLLDIKGTVLRLPSDRTVRLLYIDLYRDKIVAKPNGIIDFNTAVPSKGASDCHGLAFNLDKYY